MDSAQRRAAQRSLDGDGAYYPARDHLTWMVVVNDPIYLTEPFVRTTDFNLNLQQNIAPYPCESVSRSTVRWGWCRIICRGPTLF